MAGLSASESISLHKIIPLQQGLKLDMIALNRSDRAAS